MLHLNGNNGAIMKVILAQSYIRQSEYLKNISEYSKIDESIFNCEKDIEGCTHTSIVKVFHEDFICEFLKFIKKKLSTSEEYSDIKAKSGIKRLYLSLNDADDLIQLTDLIDKIDDDDEWQVCIDIIKHTPDFSPYWMGLSKNPYILCALFEDSGK